MRTMISALLLAGAATLAGCNTVRGVGADVQSVADAFDPNVHYAACGSYGPIDRDNDGRISQAEWNAYRTGAYPSWDLNHDGRISRKEYAQCWYGGGFYSHYQQANWQPAWTAFDANGDGWISPDEYWGTSAWSTLDANHDGYIDSTEWGW